jgi:hypothetical protein
MSIFFDWVIRLISLNFSVIIDFSHLKMLPFVFHPLHELLEPLLGIYCLGFSFREVHPAQDVLEPRV